MTESEAMDELERLLEALVNDSYTLDNPSSPWKAHEACVQCGSMKRRPHKPLCAVGRAEAFLRHLEA